MNNLTKRIISGALFGVIMICGIVFNACIFGALFLFIMYMTMDEFFRLSLGTRFGLQQKLAKFAAAAFFIVIMMHFCCQLPLKWLAVPVLIFMAIPVSAVFFKDWTDFSDYAYLYTGFLYAALPICLMPFLTYRSGEYDGLFLLSFFILIWSSDIGAYTFGSLFGQKENSRKLAPKISPKKSWWGFWGGVVLSVGIAVALHFIGILPLSLTHSVAVGLIVSVGAVLGDLVESVWKRYFGVKDSGNIIPGHGGMLDRFDSTLVAFPLTFVYLALLSLI